MSFRLLNLRKPITVLFCILFVLPLILISPFIINAQFNNLRLAIFARQLMQIQLPDDITLVENQRQLLNYGNGRYCGFQSTLLLTSELTKEESEAYFEPISNRRFDGLIFSRNGAMPPVLKFVDSEEETVLNTVTFSIGSFGHVARFDTRCW